ncbi:AMP-binding protein [Haladaptatus sp. CMSO5]|uniref:AMP-binding protein n=1 Tax=Haladaptatus sp. CMSO5 TaxID=3120514 RepID=UPI002FCDE579
MDTFADLLARERRSGAPALRTHGSRIRRYTYTQLCTLSWQSGSVLRHVGVAKGRKVALAASQSPEPVLTFLGAGLLGAVVEFEPEKEVDARALVAPSTTIADYELPPGGQRIAYGERPDDPSTMFFEKEVWSENPVIPPIDISPDDPVLAAGGEAYTQGQLLAAAERVIEEYDITDEDEVAIRTPLTEPGTVVAGILAPLVVGGTIVFPGEDGEGTVAVADGDAPESRVIALADVQVE